MKLRNLLLYITAFTLAAVNSSCKDDEEETTPDPRIRRVIIPQIGSDVVFIVNDTEGKIYNYDSLAYGTRIDSLYPSIYSYSENNNSFQYSYNGSDFIEFRNTVALNFTKPVSIISTNAKNKSKKEYTLEVRVHKYDVDAFQWTNAGTVSGLEQAILSQKSLMQGNVMWQFYQTNDACNAIFSTDGKQWSNHTVSAPETLELSTLCNLGDTLYVQGKSGAVYKAASNNLYFYKLEAITSGQLLYSLNNQIWMLDGGYIKSYSNSGVVKVSQPLPEKFAVDTVRPFTAPSGYTVLGYLYAKKGDNAEIWAADRYGNVECLTNASEGLPYLDKTIAFNFGSTLGILGGILTDGTYSTKCYTSNDSGLTWSSDEHKDLSNAVGAIADAGVFQTGDKGEFILVGGKTASGQSNKIWALRLKKLLLEEAFLNKLK